MDIRETKAQLDVLQVIYEQEYVRTPHLSLLLPHREYSGMTRTLKALERRKLIVRFRNNLYSTYIFHISEAGKQMLFRHRGPHHYVRTYRPITDYRIEFQHKVGIAETIANLRAGVAQHGCRLISQGELEEAIGKEDGLPFNIKATATWEGHPSSPWTGFVQPDGIFSIEYPDGTRSNIFLEYQRCGKVKVNTLLGISSMRRKYLSYQDIYHSGAAKALGFKSFRVLFVFSQEADFRRSLKLAQEMYPDGNPLCLHVFQPEYRETPTGMLITPEVNPGLFVTPLARAGLPDVPLYDPKKDPA
jgi:DNA-binding MarR family transcriptional regulator